MSIMSRVGRRARFERRKVLGGQFEELENRAPPSDILLSILFGWDAKNMDDPDPRSAERLASTRTGVPHEAPRVSSTTRAARVSHENEQVSVGRMSEPARAIRTDRWESAAPGIPSPEPQPIPRLVGRNTGIVSFTPRTSARPRPVEGGVPLATSNPIRIDAVTNSRPIAISSNSEIVTPQLPVGVPSPVTNQVSPLAVAIESGTGVQRGGFLSVQVNVNPAGQNIVGDAANEPSIAVDPTNPNRMAIGWRQFDTISSNFRQAGRGYTANAGQTWTFPGVLQPGQFRSDPVLETNTQGQFFYYSLSTVTSAEIFKSVNGAVTFTGPTPAFGGDKAWMTIDKTSGVGQDNIYATWQRFFSCCDANIFTRSVNDGASFETPVPVAESPLFGTIDVGPGGEVYVAGVRGVDFQDFDTPVIARSSNAQNPAVTPTFELGRAVNLGGSLAIGDGPNPVGLLGQVWVATDHSFSATRGNVYMLASVDPPGPDPLDVMFARSSDGGATWSNPIRVNDDAAGTNAWQWFGTMSVAPDGRIDAVWNDTRSSGQDNLSETYMSYSLDGGQTWSRNVAISPMWNSFLGWPSQNKVGDYYDMVSDVGAAHLAYAATFHGEQDVYYLKIAPDCNANGVHDGSDILGGGSLDRNHNQTPDECDADFNHDQLLNLADIDALIAAIAAGTNQPAFNLTENAAVNLDDRDAWLAAAGKVNLGSGRVYRIADANLDSVVDGTDFGIWNSHKFTEIAAWSQGDFNADGDVDGSDFNLWNANKFTSA